MPYLYYTQTITSKRERRQVLAYYISFQQTSLIDMGPVTTQKVSFITGTGK
jgi:hypothetical protein